MSTTKVTRALLAASLLIACSGRSEPVTPEPSTAPPTSVAPPSSAPVATTVEAAPPEDPIPTVDPSAPVVALAVPVSEVRGRYVAELDVEDLELPQGHVVRVLHPNRAVRARLDAVIASALTEFAARASAAAAEDGTEPYDLPTCTARVATRTIVSLLCVSSWMPNVRGGGNITIADAYAFQIVGEEVLPTDLAAGLVPNANIRAAYDRALARAVDAEYDTGSSDDVQWSDVGSAIGAYGIDVIWADAYEMSGGELSGTVPYADIIDQIRSDGPIARLLHLGAYARGATPPPASDTAGAATATGPWTIGAAMPSTEAASRWAALPANLRSAVSVYTAPGVTHLGVRAEVGADVAQQVATALHGTLAAAPSDARPFAFELRNVNGSVNVRAEDVSSAPWLATLPRDAVTVVLVDASPNPSAASSWLDVLPAPGIEGYSSGRYLEPGDCYPDATSAIAALPAAAREAATRDMLRVRATAFDAGRSQGAVLFLSHDTAHSYVSLRRLSPTCRVGSELASWTVDGVVVDALVTRTTQSGGETLVLVQTAADATASAGATHWLALRRGTATPVWSRECPTHPSQTNDMRAPARMGPSGRGFWPLAIVARGAPIEPYRWDGTTLVRDTP